MKPATRARKNARGRLLRFLMRGGRLVEDESGHYCRASRSGEPYDRQMVLRLIEKGAKVVGQEFRMTRDPNTQTWALVALD